MLLFLVNSGYKQRTSGFFLSVFFSGFKGHVSYFRGIQGIHQGKSRWHSYLVLVYMSHVLTYLLGTVPYILTMG